MDDNNNIDKNYIQQYPEQLIDYLPQNQNSNSIIKNQYNNSPQFIVEDERNKRRGSDPQKYFKVTDHLDKGKVTIDVKMARNLVANDLNGKSDPYVVITCQDKKWKSKIINKNLNPVFNEKCIFDLKKINQSTTILVRVFDHDLIGSDELLGECYIFCAGITKNEVVSWYKLEKTKHGDIELGIFADFELEPFDPLVNVENGTLSVKCIKGRNLIAADLNGKSDPYCIISFQENYFESKVQYKTLNPVWEETFEVKLTNINQRTVLPIIVMDEDDIGSDDFIGLALIPLAGLNSGESKTKWYDLHGVKHGEIQVELVSSFNLPTCPSVLYETVIESSCYRIKHELKNLQNHHNHSKQELLEKKKKEKTNVFTKLKGLVSGDEKGSPSVNVKVEEELK